MDKRMGFVGIIIGDRAMAPQVNAVLSDFGDIINGRIGVPDHRTGQSVIGLIVEGSNDTLGALTGRLGNLKGVECKAALTKKKENKYEQ
jgi:putative iron-only hydrogenase system regulator